MSAPTSLTDSIQLSPTIVKGYAPERFLAGQKFRKIEEGTLKQFQFYTLSELLRYATPLAIKNYGPGQLATISFRGTSASHTAVLWNGVNINQPTLGQTDFSTIALGGFKEIGIQYGSSSSVTGTDAVGGSIHLNSQYQSEQGLSAQIGRSQASFNNHATQFALQYGKRLRNQWQFSSNTHVMIGKVNNAFSETERRGYLMSVAHADRKSFIQDFFLHSNRNQTLSAHIWLSDNNAVLQPYLVHAREKTHTKAYRTMLKYSTGSWEARVSWMRDILNYGKGDYTTMSLATTDKIGAQVTKEWDGNWGSKVAYAFRSGAEVTHVATRVTGYHNPYITELRTDFFTSARFRIQDKWLFSGNLRQALVTGFNPPITPSIGVDYRWFATKKWRSTVKASLSRSYRVPTLNERYWEDIGDPNIRPEHGWNKEIGIDFFTSVRNGSTLTLKATGFHKRIHNWAFWNPLKGNKVESLQEVVAKGVESEVAFVQKKGSTKYGSTFVYSYTHSSQQKIYDAYAADIVGKQLPLTPKHTGNVTAWLGIKQYRLTAQIALQGVSYQTSEETQPLPAYSLLNIFAEGTFQSRKLSLRVQPQVVNVTNGFYLDVRRNAMPGRSYALQLIATFKDPK